MRLAHRCGGCSRLRSRSGTRSSPTRVALSDPFFDVRMLAHNTPLVVTYLRACVLATMLYCMFYGFSQWLESGTGFSSAPWPARSCCRCRLRPVARRSSAGGRRAFGSRSSSASALWWSDARRSARSAAVRPPWIIAAVAILFGHSTRHVFGFSTQAAVYIQAPPNEIGTAAGLQRTAFYLGAIIAASVLALVYGQHASTAGFLHSPRDGLIERRALDLHHLRPHASARSRLKRKILMPLHNSIPSLH